MGPSTKETAVGVENIGPSTKRGGKISHRRGVLTLIMGEKGAKGVF